MKKLSNIIYLLIAALILLFLLSYSLIAIGSGKAHAFLDTHTIKEQTIKNGDYCGKYRLWGLNMAAVAFKFENRKITTIEFSKLATTPGFAYKKKIIEEIKKSGSPDFDSISGATRTSSFAKAAIRQAFLNQETPIK